MKLVVGATGTLGFEVCRQLAKAGKPVRALVRSMSDPAKKAALTKLGAELVEGDLKDRASLDHACRGATAVITTPTAIMAQTEADTFESVDRRGQMDLIDAARAAKCGHFVFISVSGKMGKKGGNPLIDAKRAVEKHLQQSGLTCTILRPTFFMEIWLGPHLGFDAQNGKATIYGSGQAKISYISLEDVAEFAVRALHDPSARNVIVELGGPEALSQLEVVRIFEDITGRKFELQFVAEEQLIARRAAAGNPVEKTFADLTLAAARGDSIDMRDTLRCFPVQLKSVREHAQSVTGGRSS
ncbi:MAG: SDR family oxidoreductase [Chthoniobacterales bacterium]